jgi:hypothetical protein
LQRRIARACSVGLVAALLSTVIAWKLWKYHYLAWSSEYDCWPPLSPTRLACLPEAVFAIVAVGCAAVALGSFGLAAVLALRAGMQRKQR